MLGMSTCGRLFLLAFLAASAMDQNVSSAAAELGSSLQMSRGGNLAMFGVWLVESLLAALTLCQMVRRQDEIHVPSWFAVSVAKNKVGFSGKSQWPHVRMDTCVVSEQA